MRRSRTGWYVPEPVPVLEVPAQIGLALSFTDYYRQILSLTCRTRKLKCDEQKPQCSQCRKASRECRPSEGIVFRHQQNASMNKDEDEGQESRGGLKGFYSYKNTFDEDSVWLEIPKQGVFLSTQGNTNFAGLWWNNF